jgi:RNA polymerase sigma-70 factor (ECF subfamily)
VGELLFLLDYHVPWAPPLVAAISKSASSRDIRIFLWGNLAAKRLLIIKGRKEADISGDVNSRSIDASRDSPAQSAPIDWEQALRDCWGWLLTVVRSRVGDPDVADDVMQEVAVAVLEHRSRPTDRQKVAPWLYRLAVRHTANYWRGAGRRRRLVNAYATDLATKSEPGISPREWVFRSELKESIASAIQTLHPIDRDVLLLKYTEGWSYRQLAERLGVTEKTIEHRLAKARRALRQELSEYDSRSRHHG